MTNAVGKKARRRARLFAAHTLPSGRVRCTYCGESADPIVMTLDHKIPKSRGGTTVPSNVVPACILCNQAKADLHTVDFVIWLASDDGRRWLLGRPRLDSLRTAMQRMRARSAVSWEIRRLRSWRATGQPAGASRDGTTKPRISAGS